MKNGIVRKGTIIKNKMNQMEKERLLYYRCIKKGKGIMAWTRKAGLMWKI